MYQDRFHLEIIPFSMTPDPGLLYMTPMHREALSGLVYAILEHKGFVVLTGEAGTGKTTLLSRLLRYVPEERASFSLVLNPTLSPAEFLESALWDFGITDIPESKVHRLQKLQQLVTASHIKGKTCVLIVDEAHKLSPEVLEEIRLLTNFETADHKLLQIVLVGQDELRATLNRNDLRQLKQRIAVRFELKPLAADEVYAYMRYRWAASGGQEFPFEREAVQSVARASGGVPRVINAICDNALLLIYANEAPWITSEHIRLVLTDLDLSEPTMPVAPSAALRAGLAPGLEARPTHPASVAPGVAPIRLEIPKPAAVPEVLPPVRLTTLERYLPPEPKPTLWMKWAVRF